MYLPYFIKNLIIRKITKINKGFHDDVLFKYLMNGMLDKLDLSQSTTTDVTLENLAGLCLNLTEINFNKGIRKFTEIGLIQSIPNIENLVSLEIAWSDVVTDVFIEKLAAGCKNLTLLDIGGCVKITDRAMTYAKDLKLTQLNVSHTPISDDGLQSLSEGVCSKSLVDINISYCNVTKNGLRLLDWRKIKSLGIQGIDFGGKLSFFFLLESYWIYQVFVILSELCL